MGNTCYRNGQRCSCTSDIEKGNSPPCSLDQIDNWVTGTKPVLAPPTPLRSGNVLPEDDAKRGLYPMAEGCLDYFPNALAEVSRISFEGNEKHNPGEQMGWAREKSTDHRNKIIRHTVDSREDTETAIEHAAQAAWRALAHLQTKIETVRGIRQSPASK